MFRHVVAFPSMVALLACALYWIYLAVAHGEIYAGPSSARRWITYDSHPEEFTVSCIILLVVTLCLASVVLLYLREQWDRFRKSTGS